MIPRDEAKNAMRDMAPFERVEFVTAAFEGLTVDEQDHVLSLCQVPLAMPWGEAFEEVVMPWGHKREPVPSNIVELATRR